MKSIKNFLTATLIILSAYTYAQPVRGGQGARQQQGPPPVPGDKQIEKMVTNLASELSLSADQKTKVLSLYKEHFKQVNKKASGKRRPNREEMEALDATLEKNVKDELTKDQTSKYEAYLKEKSKRPPPRKR